MSVALCGHTANSVAQRCDDTMARRNRCRQDSRLPGVQPSQGVCCFLATYTNPHAFIAVGDPRQLRAATQQTAQTGRCGIVADAHTGPDIQQNL